MTAAQKSYFYAYLDKRMIIEIDSIEDISKKLPLTPAANERRLACTPSEIAQGLLRSQYENSLLNIDDTAPQLPTERIQRNEYLVVIENEGLTDQIVAVNYAFSIEADVVLVKPFEKPEIRDLQKLIYEWTSKGFQEAYKHLQQKATARIGHIDISKYKCVTFFTQGFPYGLLLKNVIPCAHVLLNVKCDLFVINNIGYESFPSNFDSALVFSPKEFDNEETDDVIQMLEQSRYSVKSLLADGTSVKALTNYGGHYARAQSAAAVGSFKSPT
jgi:hypothetical protein